MDILNYYGKEICECGKVHTADINKIIVGKGVISQLPDLIAGQGAKKVFILCDVNTYEAAGKDVCDTIEKAGVSYSKYVFSDKALEPDEKAVGSAVMHFDNECDLIIGVGSGVINDIGKILANISKRPYFIVGTAPSMDGYASASSSMSRDGLKVSISSKSADVIIGDIDILSKAPEKMLISGLGDMLAKYISICEWRIANIITGEYYCESIAQLIRGAVKKCVDNAEGLLRRDEKAIEAVFEGLVIGGVAMTYAGVSRPASGVEHYISHIWDMRGLELGTNVDLHGIQCAIGTYIAAGLYEKIKNIVPDKDKALKYVSEFDIDAWNNELKEFMGNSADTMIALEKKEQKYNTQKHKERIEVIISNWDKIVEIINEEIPSVKELDKIFDTIGAFKKPSQIGIDERFIPMTFKASRDIRYKYVLSHLAWDLGITEDIIK